MWYVVLKPQSGSCGGLYLERRMSEGNECLLEESIPWEVRLLKEYCNSTADLDSVSKLVGSYLTWQLAM